MTDKPPSFHAANCRREDCDWGTIRSSMLRIYADLEEHFKDDHGVSETEWREIRDDFRKPNRDLQTSLEGFA